MRAPNWTIEEFTFVVNNPQLNDQEIADHLPQRTVGVVSVVRSGMHSFHMGDDISMLSTIMLDYLTLHRQLRCPRCAFTFDHKRK